MAEKHPYVNTQGGLLKAIEHLRKSFPKEVSAATLKKLGIAPQNESYIVNTLRFLGVIDEEGKKVQAKCKAFLQHEDSAFHAEFEKLIRDAYAELFDLHGDESWAEDKNSLTQFFRNTDHSTEVVGKLQAQTFKTLAGLSGHGELPSPRTRNSKAKKTSSKKTPAKRTRTADASSQSPATSPQELTGSASVGLTVRIEVNLPADGDQETYDSIFRSIRKNLIDRE